MRASQLLADQKELKVNLKHAERELEEHTIWTIEALTDEQIQTLLYLKWIDPIISALNQLKQALIDDLVTKVTALVSKYAVTLNDIEHDISTTEQELSSMLSQLRGNDFDIAAISTLQNLLKHGK